MIITRKPTSNLDHGVLIGLADDDHTQYTLLAGRAGGQVQIGGIAAGENLTLQSTAHATRGLIIASDPIQVSNQAGAIQAGAYTFQARTDVVDGASAIGFDLIATNNLGTTGAKVVRIKSGVNEICSFNVATGLGSFGADIGMLDFSNSGTGGIFAGGVLQTNTLGVIWFQTTAGATGTRLGILPSGPQFMTEATGTDANPADIIFGRSSGAMNMFHFYEDTTYGASIYPQAITGKLGKHTGDLVTGKWGGAYFTDNAKVMFGQNADASIYYDGTDLKINPKEVGTGIADILGTANAVAYQVGGVAGASGTFTTTDGKTVTVTNGLITSIV